MGKWLSQLHLFSNCRIKAKPLRNNMCKVLKVGSFDLLHQCQHILNTNNFCMFNTIIFFNEFFPFSNVYVSLFKLFWPQSYTNNSRMMVLPFVYPLKYIWYTDKELNSMCLKLSRKAALPGHPLQCFKDLSISQTCNSSLYSNTAWINFSNKRLDLQFNVDS